MTEIAKKLELSLAEKEHSRNELAEKLNSATFQQAENITAVIEVNFDFNFLGIPYDFALNKIFRKSKMWELEK